MKKTLSFLGIFALFTFLFLSCSSDDNSNSNPANAVVTTAAITASTATTATGGGEVTSEGETAVTARGLVWSTSTNPTIADFKTTDGSGIGVFSSGITNLITGTTYYIRAYATNTAGTVYGNQITITPSSTATMPTLTTTAASGLGSTSITSGGIISSDGGSAVTARGVVWAATANPTVSNSKTVDGAGAGAFVSSITGLTASTVYYIRSYATNSVGTAYGSQIIVTTTATSSATTVTDIDGNVYPIITICAQQWMKSNLNVSKYRNGDAIPQVQDMAQWANLSTGAWCYYANQTANGTIYGKLYNWYAVHDPRGLAPTGWHVPSENEYDTLATCLGGWGGAGDKMKEAGTAHWMSPNNGTNSSGFTGLPGGLRVNEFDAADPAHGFDRITQDGHWWTSSYSDPAFPDSGILAKVLVYSTVYLGTDGELNPKVGMSVRCVKD